MLTPDQIKQAERIRYMAESVKAEDIRPISKEDDDTMRASRAAGLAVWNVREAFVVYFFDNCHSSDDHANEFRKACAADYQGEYLY